MIASLIASVLAVASTEFSDDPEQHSVWMQQACRIQQVGYGGGEPDITPRSASASMTACVSRPVRRFIGHSRWARRGPCASRE